MIGAIVRKDWTLLWPMVAIVTIIQICLAWFAYNWGLFGGEPAPRELREPLTLAWFVGIGALVAAVVHQDPLPGVEQDWLVRPLARTDLLLAKLLFAVLVVCAPMLVLDGARVVLAGFSLSAALPALLYKEAYVLLTFVVPVMALAAITATMAELVLLGAGLIAVFATALCIDAWLLGAAHCPTCDSGVAWTQHVLQHLGILVGAGVILAAQYYRRSIRVSRALAVIGVLGLVFVQLPWNVAFAVQRWLSPASGAARAVAVLYDAAGSTTAQPAEAAQGGGIPHGRAVPRTRLDATVQYLERHGPARAAAVTLLLPVRIEGLARDELLLVDRSDVALLGERGATLYRGINRGTLDTLDAVRAAAAGRSDASLHGAPPHMQAIELPARVYSGLGRAMLRLRLDYSMTLMRAASRHLMEADGGVLQAEDLGHCAARPDRGGSMIQLRCEKMGRTPFCLSVTLYGDGGQRNPETLQCDPDYRPYLPAPTDPLNRFGVDIPLRDPTGVTHYPLEGAQLAGLHLLITVYAVREHAMRSTLTPPIRLMDLNTGNT